MPRIRVGEIYKYSASSWPENNGYIKTVGMMFGSIVYVNLTTGYKSQFGIDSKMYRTLSEVSPELKSLIEVVYGD